jgi:hypothetical protein
MIAVFWKWLARKLEGVSETPIYWMIFWVAYMTGWAKGVESVFSVNPKFAPVALLFGFIWFWVIFIIMIKSAGQVGKRKDS